MADICFDVDTALAEVAVNKLPIVDAATGATIKTDLAYNASGLALFWHFVTPAGAHTVTAVTPTSGGSYDWAAQSTSGIYTIEIPASGGASINNDTEGHGWFTGFATGYLPWCSPVYCFRAAGLNDLLIEGAYSTTRGLAGTALPNAAADAAGGLPISDAGGLDLDSIKSDTAAILVDTGTTLQAELDGIQADTEDIQARLPAALVGGRIDANVGAISGDSVAADNLETAFDDTAGAVPWIGIVDQGTAQAATATTIQLRSAAAFASDQLIGAVVTITGGSAGVGQSRTITDYDGSTDTATVDTWTTTPSGTITYKIFVSPPADSTGASIKTVTDKLNTMLELTSASPGEWEFTADSLRNAPSGPGGGGGGGLDEAGVRAAIGLASANLDTQLAAIKADTAATLIDTAEIGAAGAGLTALPWNAAWDAEVQSECTDALNAYDPPTRAELTTDTNSVLTAVGDVPTNAELATALDAIPTATENADALLARDLGSGTNAGTSEERTVRSALRFLRNKWAIVTGTLTVRKEDDTTAAWTAAVSTTSGADPVTGNDPT